eukprot:scaffold109870_cov33-Phaeocystis_antarctica.AAC.1
MAPQPPPVVRGVNPFTLLTPLPSHLFLHTSPFTPLPSHLSLHTSPFTPLPSHLSLHTSGYKRARCAWYMQGICTVRACSRKSSARRAASNALSLAASASASAASSVSLRAWLGGQG